MVRAQNMIFYEPFENTSTISGNGGSYGSSPSFANGVLGNSVTFQGFTINYPVSDNLNINEGTVSFWVKPIAWNEGSPGGNGFFDLGDLAGCLMILQIKIIRPKKYFFNVFPKLPPAFLNLLCIFFKL